MTVEVKTTTIPAIHRKRIIARVEDQAYEARDHGNDAIYITGSAITSEYLEIHTIPQIEALIEVLHAVKAEFFTTGHSIQRLTETLPHEEIIAVTEPTA